LAGTSGGSETIRMTSALLASAPGNPDLMNPVTPHDPVLPAFRQRSTLPGHIVGTFPRSATDAIPSIFGAAAPVLGLPGTRSTKGKNSSLDVEETLWLSLCYVIVQQ
jgi:hypothetical protein